MTSQVLPTVESPTIQATASIVVPSKNVSLVTNVAVDAVELAIKAYKQQSKAAREAEKVRNNELLTFFGTLLGITTLDELRELNPVAITNLMTERAQQGKIAFEPGAHQFKIDHEKDQVRPEWKAIAIKLAGEAKAMAEAALAQRKYSYTVSRVKPTQK